MTRFFCQELLFDYISGQLPDDRKAEVEAYLKTDDVCREDLTQIKKAMGYCKHLSLIKTPDEWAQRWRNLPPALAKRISNWEFKIVSKLWSALPYTVSVIVIALGLVIFKPWRTLFSKQLVVWSASESAPVQTTAAIPTPVPPATPAVPETTPESKDAILKSEELGPPEKVEDVAATTIFGSARQANDVKAEEDSKPAVLKEAAKGELYRWFLSVDNFTDATEEVKQKILELKGDRARKVELGWHSKEDESYFHFTLPESNSDELVKYLKTLGPVRMLKEKHPVVMPQGKIRIILILKENAEGEDQDNDDDKDTTPSEEP